MEQRLVREVFKVGGMTCNGCEMSIENALRRMKGIIEVKAVYSSSVVHVAYDADILGPEQVINAIESLDYKVINRSAETAAEAEGREGRHLTAGDERPGDEDIAPITGEEKSAGGRERLFQGLGIGIIVLALYVIIKSTVGFNFIPEVNQSMGYGLLFIAGLLTSIHCAAMCGGINLSQSVSHNADPVGGGRLARLKPSLLYNGGRVVSYTVIGGIVGALGSVVSFSGTAKGIVAVVTGSLMVIIGLNMLNVFPWLRKINLRMPRFFGNKIYNNSGMYGPFLVGLLNGLMPCGPLQSMQLYALGTGSFAAGALSMFMFSMGTVPLMFGLGALSSVLTGKFRHGLLKFSAALVIILGLVMANRGLMLSGVSPIPGAGTRPGNASSAERNVARIEDDVQVVTTKLESGRYTPITVQKGIPLRWIIKADKSDLNGCNNPLTIPQYDIEVRLKAGENIIEFTPETEGNIVYTCWMGMISSNIKVVPDISAAVED